MKTIILITLVVSAAADCVLKPGSHLVSGSNGLTCEKCPIHTYGIRDTSATDPQQMFKCLPCGAGTYALQRGSVECIKNRCPKNTMRVATEITNKKGETTVCVPCPSNSIKDTTGQCFCAKGSQLVNGTCEQCPAHTYQDKDKSDHCKPCPAGTLSFKTGATSCTTNTCAAGTYATASSDNSVQCSACPAMTYSEAGATQCTKCAHGTYSKGGASQCIKSTCKAGEVTFVASVQRRRAGVWSYMPPLWRDGMCLKCPRGWYSDLDGSFDCKKCPAGSTTSHHGASSLSACHRNNCPVGTRSHSVATPQGTQSTCEPCPAGTYQPKAGATTCLPCSAGTFSFGTGNTKCSATSKCPKGEFQDPSNPKQCRKCAKGKYNNVVGARACRRCPENTWAWSTGSKKCTGVVCDVGKYKPSENSKCMACAPGKFQTRMNQARCDDCPYGKWQFSSSQNACVRNHCKAGTKMVNNQGKCVACGVNKFSRDGAVTCSQCPTGKFRRANQPDCVPSTCPAGMYETGTKCEYCGAGTYSPSSGATKCKPCGNGLGTDGKTGQSACWKKKKNLNTKSEDVGYHVCSGKGKLLGCKWNKVTTKTTAGELPMGSSGVHYSLRITHHDSNNGGLQFNRALMSHKCGVVTTSSGAECKCWCWKKRHATDLEAQSYHKSAHDGANGKLTNPTAFRTQNYNRGKSPKHADVVGGRPGKNNVGYSSKYDAVMNGTPAGVNNDRFETFKG